MKYAYCTFKELFDHHIQYAYEPQYGCHLDTIEYNIHGVESTQAATFHKLTIYDIGWLEYKGHWEEYDPRLWPKVKALAEMLIETEAEKVLFKAKKNSPESVEES
jgi:hypothetical protein